MAFQCFARGPSQRSGTWTVLDQPRTCAASSCMPSFHHCSHIRRQAAPLLPQTYRNKAIPYMILLHGSGFTGNRMIDTFKNTANQWQCVFGLRLKAVHRFSSPNIPTSLFICRAVHHVSVAARGQGCIPTVGALLIDSLCLCPPPVPMLWRLTAAMPCTGSCSPVSHTSLGFNFFRYGIIAPDSREPLYWEVPSTGTATWTHDFYHIQV